MAGNYNFVAATNETFSPTITYRDSGGNLVNLTGYTAAMDVRDGAGTLVIRSDTSPSGSEGTVTLGGTAGTVAVTISATLMSALTPGVYSYDLVLTSGSGVKKRLLAGSFAVVAGVTA